jgi:hypothetical protein
MIEWAAEEGKGAGFERIDMLIDGQVVSGRAHTSSVARGEIPVPMRRVPPGSFEVSVRGRKRSQRFVESPKVKLSGGSN